MLANPLQGIDSPGRFAFAAIRSMLQPQEGEFRVLW
jgi:hypothetical protein